jgi:2-keto-4-pentenoate hydratase
MAVTLTRERILEIAEALLRAESTHNTIPPLSETYPGINADDAYQVQQVVLERKLGGGRKVVAKKVGLTSKAMQQMFGVDQPDYGQILDNMIIQDGASFRAAELIQPRIEPELAFLLKRDLKGPGITAQQVVEATDYVFPALEVIDSRIRDWKIKLVDTISDNASSARVVTGQARRPAQGVDLPKVVMVFEKNGQEIGRATGEAVLGSPANAVAWLANKLAEYGTVIKAGEFVMPGAFTAATPVQAGDVVRATVTGIGSVTVRFT